MSQKKMESCVQEFRSATNIFTYHRHGKSFEEANNHCMKAHNGSLAIIKDKDTLASVITHAPRIECFADYYRIGLFRKTNQDKYVWIDNTTFAEPSSIDFSNGDKPKCGSAGLLVSRGLKQAALLEISCNFSLPYLCAASYNKKTLIQPKTTNNHNSGDNEPSDDVSNPTNVPLIVGSALGSALLLIIIVIAIVATLTKRKRTNRNRSNVHEEIVERNEIDPYSVQVLSNFVEPTEYASIDDVKRPLQDEAITSPEIKLPSPEKHIYTQVHKVKKQGPISKQSENESSQNFAGESRQPSNSAKLSPQCTAVYSQVRKPNLHNDVPTQ